LEEEWDESANEPYGIGQLSLKLYSSTVVYVDNKTILLFAGGHVTKAAIKKLHLYKDSSGSRKALTIYTDNPSISERQGELEIGISEKERINGTVVMPALHMVIKDRNGISFYFTRYEN
jgi:hypothetical protein